MKLKFLVPLAIFLGLAGFLGYGLTLNPSVVPSPLVDKPAPDFRLATLDSPGQTFGVDDLHGQVWLLNVWASWCVSCRAEHPYLIELARAAGVPVVGLNYKDEPDAARRYLRDHGDPYAAIAVDRDGRVGIEYGVYGTPETFLIDRDGVIRYKHVGPIHGDIVRNVLLPRIMELNRAG